MDRMRGEVFAEQILRRIPVLEPLPVVVAVDEKPLDAAAVRRLVVREHRAPDAAHGLKLLDKTVVGEVAAYGHAVHAPVTEPFKRAAESVFPIERVLPVPADKPDVDVAYDAEHEPLPGLAGGKAAAAKSAGEHSPAKEPHGAFGELTSAHHGRIHRIHDLSCFAPKGLG